MSAAGETEVWGEGVEYAGLEPMYDPDDSAKARVVGGE